MSSTSTVPELSSIFDQATLVRRGFLSYQARRQSPHRKPFAVTFEQLEMPGENMFIMG